MSYSHKFTVANGLVKIDEKEIHAYGYKIEKDVDSVPMVIVEFYANELDVKE